MIFHDRGNPVKLVMLVLMLRTAKSEYLATLAISRECTTSARPQVQCMRNNAVQANTHTLGSQR